MVYIDIDKEILYWIDEFGLEWVDCGKLIDYIKDNYVKCQRDVVEEYVEAMEIKVPSIDILNWGIVCAQDNDYEMLSDGRYLNVYRLESDYAELKKLKLIK